MAYPVSARFLATRTDGTRIVAQVTVLEMGSPVLGPVAVETATLTCSRTQAQRCTLDVTLDPTAVGQPPVVPTDLTSPVAPNGNELLFEVGYRYSDGSVEMVPCGIFPIQTVTVTDTGADLTLQIAAADRSWSISRRVLKAPYTVSGSTTLDEALYRLLTANTSGLPPFSYNIQTSSAAAGGNTYNEGQDPWQAALDLASGAGFELFFDRWGNLTARPIPDPGSITPTWAAGEQTPAAPLGIARVLTANQVGNDFVVFTSSTNGGGTPLRAEVEDTNPRSPTWVGGSYGDIPVFLSSSAITDVAGCEAAAQSQLFQSLGQIDTATLTVLPNPAVDVDDVYTVSRQRMNLSDSLWVVDGYTLPVGVSQTMQITVRRVVG